ncbi:MAG: MOSC domain-containing protein [Candidatus Limnocylindria bacterium]
MPRVARLSIAPVKSLGLLHPRSIVLTERGVAEDRRFYLIDGTGRLMDRLVLGHLVQVGAWTDTDATVLRLTFPDGRVVEGEVEVAEPVVTPMYGRRSEGHTVTGPFGAALSAFAGRDITLVRTNAPGGTRDHHPATFVTDGSLERLGQHLGVGAVDGRRFRMLVELDGGAAHEEDTWIGRRIAVGGAELRVSAPVPRCAITTQDPDTGERDLDTLRTIISYRGLRNDKDIDFGVWGEVDVPGTITVGDEVRLLD